MAANYRGIPNHVQIGINDTPLTSALEKGYFKAAEKLIEENMEPSYLDEGPFEKIPLALVLSSEAEFREFPRHLHLAKLLAEGGANPNLRIPQAEWQGASPSPMEYLLDLYDLASDLCRGGSDDVSNFEDLIDPLFTIGLHDETKLTPIELKEQLLELLDVFLACGGNPNVTTTTSNSTLYHVVVAHPDPNMELVMKLCEAGGDLNQTNVHGTTPLMDLVTYADGDLAMDILYSIWNRKPDISSLQTQNCSNETALWRSMLAGSPTVATELLHHGASPTPRAMITIGKWHRVSKSGERPITREIATHGVSAILAPLLQDSSPYVRHTAACTRSKFDVQEAPHSFHVHLLDKVFSCAISPVVDNTAVSECFPQTVLDEVGRIASEETQFAFDSLVSSAIKPQDVAILTFGKLSAGLQQLCVRRIMDHVFFAQNPCKSLELIVKLKGKKLITQKENKQPEDWDENEEEKDTEIVEAEFSDNSVVEETDNITQWDVVTELDKTTIHKLVKDLLNLPPSLTTRFEIEATRLQLGASLYTFESIDCIQGCDGQSDEDSLDSFAENGDDDDDDDDESDWFAGFMSSDEYGDDFMNSNVEWETDEDGSSDDDNDDEDYDSNGDEDYDDNGDVDPFHVDEDLDVMNFVGMDIESVAVEDHGMQDSDSDKHNTSPSISDGDGSRKDSAVSEDNSTGSGECVPENIHRDKYEAFGNDPCFDDTVSSSEDESHSEDEMDTSDVLHMTKH